MATRILPGNTGAEQTFGTFFFKPNMELLNQVLAGKQQNYDAKLDAFTKLKAKIDEVPALAGYDKERHDAKQKEYEGLISNVSNLYGGDLTKADAEFNDLLGTVGKDFNIHGEFTAIKNRHSGYMANYKDITERRKKGEITEAQAYGLSRQLKKTKDIGVGKDPLQWNSWQDVNLTNAVDRADFLDKFTKKWKADAEGKWGPGGTTRTTPEGLLEWRKDEHTWVSYDEVLNQGKQALRNELERTGEIESEWVYEQEVRGNNPTTKYYDDYMGKTQGKLTKFKQDLEGLNSLTGTPLQEAINKISMERIGKPLLKVDGKVGVATKAAKAELLRILQEDTNNTQTHYDNLVNQDPLTVATKMMKEKFLDKILSSEVAPYAERASFDQYDEKLKVMKSPAYAFQRKMDLLRMKHSYAMELSDHEYYREHEFEMAERLDVGETVVGEYGDTLDKHEEQRATLLGQGGLVVDGLFMQIAKGELNPDGSKKYKTDTEIRDAFTGIQDGSAMSNYAILADAQGFKRDGKKLIAIDKNGKEIVLSNNSDLDPGILYESQKQAQNIREQVGIHNQIRNEAHMSELADPSKRYSKEDIEFLNNKAAKESEADPDLKVAYNDYVTDALTRSRDLGMVDPIKPDSYEEWKAATLYHTTNKYEYATNPKWQKEKYLNLANSTTDPSKKAAYLERVKVYDKVISHKAYFKQYKGVVDRYNAGMDEQFKTRSFNILSGKSSNRIFNADGKYWLAEKREKRLNEYFHDPNNSNSMMFYLNDPATGMREEMTLPDYIAAIKKKDGGDYEYELGKVWGDETRHAFAAPLSIYEVKDGKRTKVIKHSGTVRSGFENYNTGYLDAWKKDPSFKMANKLRYITEAGLESSTPTTFYSPNAGKSYTATIHTAEDFNNPDKYHTINNSTIEFKDFPIPVMLPGGYEDMEEVIVNGKRKLQQKVNYYTGTKTFKDGEKMIVGTMEYDNIRQELESAGIGNARIRKVIPKSDKNGKPVIRPDGYRDVDFRYYQRHRKLAELLLMGESIHENEVARYAKEMGLTPYQLDKVFNIRKTRIRYKTSMTPHPNEMMAGDTYRATSGTRKTHKFTDSGSQR